MTVHIRAAIKASAAARTGPAAELEANTARKLEAARADPRRHGAWRTERWVCRGGPERQPVARGIRCLSRGVLDVINVVLLEVRMVEEVEGFHKKFQVYAFIELERARHVEVDHFQPGPRNPLNGSLGTTEKLRDEVSNTAVYGLPLARVTTEAKVKFLSGCQAGDHAPFRTKRCGWSNCDGPRWLR